MSDVWVISYRDIYDRDEGVVSVHNSLKDALEGLKHWGKDDAKFYEYFAHNYTLNAISGPHLPPIRLWDSKEGTFSAYSGDLIFTDPKEYFDYLREKNIYVQ